MTPRVAGFPGCALLLGIVDTVDTLYALQRVLEQVGIRGGQSVGARDPRGIPQN